MANEFHNLVKDCTLGSTAQELHSQNNMNWFAFNNFIISRMQSSKIWTHSIVFALPLSLCGRVDKLKCSPVTRTNYPTLNESSSNNFFFDKPFLQWFCQWTEEIAWKYRQSLLPPNAHFMLWNAYENLCLDFLVLFRRILFNLIFLSYFVSFWTFNAQHWLDREREEEKIERWR